MTEPLSAGVIGGGIGGLSAALSLLRAGLDVHVYEQAPRLSEVGAGVQVSPNASRVLHGLGLADELAATGVRPLAFHQRRWDDGRTLLRAPLAESLYGFPHYQMHRADLLGALAAALPAERVHLGHRLTGFSSHGDGAEVRFANGGTARFDVLVGADGIHSTVRRLLFGPGDPRFTGCAAYRAVVPAERVRHLDLEVTAQIWMGPGRHFVHYFISARRSVNFVAVVERDHWTRESWTDRADKADVLSAYAGWHPQVGELIGAAGEMYVWALFDRPPMPRWSDGPVTLLGDAAHAMLPFMAQGAAQAIEDGATLAALLGPLRRGADVAGALTAYEKARLPRTARLQEMSAGNKTRFHLPDGPAQRERDSHMAAGSRAWSFNALDWVYAHDATTDGRHEPTTANPAQK
ncbi:hydroxylase [Paractinoplanes deccanensis]|uniref:Hydroxylase n=1 Tax=Paractinoplanes deccanensis TaxID=113561 RepID=A0ABQ3YEN0_9ACTN|nr:FAD-dependent monooxygenase [Actinoplanes deccanensis]GID78240.1 hydroxylase [Actinoplanes deccanensis]